jgi:hypothetical protein
VIQRTDWLAALPDAVARPHGLQRLALDMLEPLPLYLIHRPTLTEGSRQEIVVTALQQSIPDPE